MTTLRAASKLRQRDTLVLPAAFPVAATAGTFSAMAKRSPASEAVRKEWERRVVAEYRSASITHHLVLWLIQIAASPDLILDGLRIVKDELAHAEFSHKTLLAAGGQMSAAIPRETLGLTRDEREPLEHSVARVCVETFCLGETVAVPLFKVLREDCDVPVARRALDRILRDEVRHRDFGWALLSHLLELGENASIRKLVERELPRMFARLRRSYSPDARVSETVPPEDRSWGLMPGARYKNVLERTVTRDYVPRFKARGFDATSAWQAAISC